MARIRIDKEGARTRRQLFFFRSTSRVFFFDLWHQLKCETTIFFKDIRCSNPFWSLCCLIVSILGTGYCFFSAINFFHGCIGGGHRSPVTQSGGVEWNDTLARFNAQAISSWSFSTSVKSTVWILEIFGCQSALEIFVVISTRSELEWVVFDCNPYGEWRGELFCCSYLNWFRRRRQILMKRWAPNI